jgi:hypothetical protein
MKRIKILGLAFMAMLALTGVVSAVSMAATLPSILPEGTSETPITATTSSGTSTFGNGILELSSSSSTGTQTGNAQKLGSFTTTFKKVESVLVGTKCTGLSNATEGEITFSGTFHIRDYKNGTVLATADILLLAPVHFSCASILEVLSGCVAGPLTPEDVKTKTLTLNLEKSGGDNKIITVLNEANTAEEACQLLAKEGSGATKLATLVTKQAITAFKKGSETNIAVEVMRL